MDHSIKKYTILVVNDSPTEIFVLRAILEKHGYHVEEALDGLCGIHRAKELMPDLIIMNVVMPVMNGYQATRKIREAPEILHIPIIINTTKDQETDEAWAKRQGTQYFLASPVTAPELLKAVEAWVGKTV